MPPEEIEAPEALEIPEEYYDDEKIEQALNDLHRAMEALDMATWRLEGIVDHQEDKVARKLRRDIHTLRTVVDERSKGNAALTGYGYDHDRYIWLLEETPNTGE